MKNNLKFTNHHISDLVVRLRNSSQRRHLTAVFPNVKINLSVLNLLREEGYIADIKQEDRSLIVSLKYIKNDPVIKKIMLVSKPSKRVYENSVNIRSFYNGLGVTIISTSKGILTDTRARELGVGGEILCQVF